MGLDKRIGPKFLHPGPGYGGSCFPKDTRALAALGTQHAAPQSIVTAAIDTNTRQRQLLVEKITRVVGGLRGKRLAVLGLAFKPNTDDIRESPALYVCRQLVKGGSLVRAYDPVAADVSAAALSDLGTAVTFTADSYEAALGADAVVIMTEWNEFRGLDLDRLRREMASPVIIDARNVLDPVQTRALGFEYVATGRGLSAAYEPVG
jgi:UDPglucose 6-dehydrogenase